MENSIDTGTQPAGYKAKALLALLALLLLSSWVYWPGLTGPLLLDDYRNLTPLDAGGGVTDLESLLTFVFGNTSFRQMLGQQNTFRHSFILAK